ncbi:MAG: TRAP transporter small permease, partial [Polyangiales bacterium]
ANVAPWVGAALGVLVLWFGFWTAERHRGRPIIPMKQGSLVLALLTAAGITALGWLMLQPNIASRWFYIILYALCTLGYVAHLARARPALWMFKIAGTIAVISPLFVYIAYNYFPDGYSWSKEVSLIMLLWVGFLGASACTYVGKHLRMEAFERMLPPKAARWVHAVGFTATGAFCAFMAVLGYQYVFHPERGAKALGGVFEQTILPDWIGTVSVPIGFTLAALRFVGAGVSASMGGTYGQPAIEEALSIAKEKQGLEESDAGAIGEAEAEAERADTESEPDDEEQDE